LGFEDLLSIQGEHGIRVRFASSVNATNFMSINQLDAKNALVCGKTVLRLKAVLRKIENSLLTLSLASSLTGTGI